MLTEIVILCLLAYLCGSVPFGVLLAKTQNMDIREHGSGNIGATNVARTMGKKAGLITLAGDVLKGLLVVFIASQWFDSTMVTALAGLAVFLGHLFSIFLKFKGGKGVATYIGFLLGLSLYLGIAFLFLWLIIAYISKYSSLSSLLSSLIAPIYFIFMSPQKFTGFFLLYIFVLFFHRSYTCITFF